MAKKKKAPETSEEFKKRIGLEKLTADLGSALAGALKESAPDLGFCLLVFDYGQKGALGYCASANREDMIKTLDEFREMLVEDSKTKRPKA